MKTKRFICAALLFVAMMFAESASAQLKTSYFMEGSYFRTDLNPALAPTRGFIALPLISGFSVGSYSNYNSYDNMYYLRDGEYVHAFNSMVSANEFLSRLPNRCIQSINSDLNIIRLGFYTLNGTFFEVGSNVRIAYNGVMPKEYFKMVKGVYDSSITIDNMSIDLNNYLESYAGTSFRLGENITVGARFKFLVGLQNGRIDINKLHVEDGKYSISGNIKLNSPEYNSTDYNNQTSTEVTWNDTQDAVWNNIHSFGGAIDLGAELRLLDKRLKVSAAITDLGFIKWSADTQMSGSITGEVNEDTDVIGLLDKSVFDMPDKFSDYTTRLTTNVNLGVEYNFLNNHFAVGALSHTRFYRNAIATEFTASFNVRPTNWMTFTASHTFLNGNTPGIFGAAINIHPRAINIFVGMDYISSTKNTTDFEPTTMSEIDSLLSPKATSYNIYIGVGFNFGRPDFLVEQ